MFGFAAAMLAADGDAGTVDAAVGGNGRSAAILDLVRRVDLASHERVI